MLLHLVVPPCLHLLGALLVFGILSRGSLNQLDARSIVLLQLSDIVVDA
jgi:hypothetical protein